MSAESEGDRKASQKVSLPFEPKKKRQKTAKKVEPLALNKKNSQPQNAQPGAGVPKQVSDRMARRMAWFCGVPSVLGMATFIVSYFIVSSGLKLSHLAVVLTSMGFFGLGVLGLSYGVISASWDEEIVGSKLGWREFTINWERMVSAWRSSREKKA